MKHLVEANVLSEPTKPRRIRALWLRTHESDIAIDPVILGELRYRILPFPTKKGMALEHWFDAGVGRLHCLPGDADTGFEWAALLARLRKTGAAMPIKGSFIAAQPSSTSAQELWPGVPQPAPDHADLRG